MKYRVLERRKPAVPAEPMGPVLRRGHVTEAKPSEATVGSGAGHDFSRISVLPPSIQRADETTDEVAFRAVAAPAGEAAVLAPVARGEMPPPEVAAVRADADAVVSELKSFFPNDSLILSVLSKMSDMDREQGGTRQSAHMDRLLLELQIHSFDNGTIATHYVNGLDSLFQHMDGKGATAAGIFRQSIGASEKYAGYQPAPDDSPSLLKEVGQPVGERALALFSLGLVTPELFAASPDLSKPVGEQGWDKFFGVLGTSVFNLATFGGGEAAYKASQKYLDTNPGLGFWEGLAGSFAAGGGAAVEQVLPIPEIRTIFMDDKATFWQKVEASFSAILKALVIFGMAKDVQGSMAKRFKSAPTEGGAPPEETTAQDGTAPQEDPARQDVAAPQEGAISKEDAAAPDKPTQISIASDAITAGKEAIREAKNWKGKEINKVLEAKGLGAQADDILDAARADLIKEADSEARGGMEKLLEKRDVGNPGRGSDRDITYKPTDEAVQGMADPAEVAKAVEASGEAVRRFNEKMRALTGGEPDVTIDTNAYRWTGADAPLEIPAEQRAAVDFKENVARHVEIRRGIEASGAPDAAARWEAYQNEAMDSRASPRRGAGGSGQMMLAKMRQQLRLEFKAADEMYDSIKGQEDAAQQKLGAENPGMDPKSMKARVNEEVASQAQKELADALKAGDFARARELQLRVKLSEPGAFAQQAAVQDVVEFQQRMSRPDPSRPGVPDAKPLTDVKALSKSSASVFAQLSEHLRGSTMGQLKTIAKYCARIDLDAFFSGLAPDVPEIDNNFSYQRMAKNAADWGEPIPLKGTEEASLHRMVEQWTGLPEGGFTEAAAQDFIKAHYEWARQRVIQMANMAAAK